MSASSNDEFRHESLHDSETIVKYLTAISDGIQSGHLVLGNNGNPMVLEPNGILKLDLKARRKDGRLKLSFKISWKEPDESAKAKTRPLVIEHKRS